MKSSNLLSTLLAMTLTVCLLFSCKKDKDGIGDQSSKPVEAKDLTDYYLVVERPGQNPRRLLIYFDMVNGKINATMDAAGMRIGFENLKVTNNRMDLDNTFQFEFTRTKEGTILLKSFPSSMHAELYQLKDATFDVANRIVRGNGPVRMIQFSSSKFLTHGIERSNVDADPEARGYYKVAAGAGWKGDGLPAFMGIIVPSWKGSNKLTMLVEKRQSTEISGTTVSEFEL